MMEFNLMLNVDSAVNNVGLSEKLLVIFDGSGVFVC